MDKYLITNSEFRRSSLRGFSIYNHNDDQKSADSGELYREFENYSKKLLTQIGPKIILKKEKKQVKKSHGGFNLEKSGDTLP